MDIQAQIADLIEQATKERSHYYTAETLRLASSEIDRLRAALAEEKERTINLRFTFSADEEKRLRAVNARLVEALRAVMDLPIGPQGYCSHPIFELRERVKAAIEQARKGE